MHPLIRLVLFFVAVVLIPLGGWHGLLLGSILLVFFWGLSRCPLDRRAWQALRRLRWLFFSLMVVYGWFTPGRYLLPEWGGWSPTLEGLVLGSERAALLALIALAAHLLLTVTPRDALVGGLALLTPRDSRFPLRLVLTLEAVGAASARLGAVRAAEGDRWRALAEVLEGAENLAPTMTHPPRAMWPPLSQWGWLVVMLPLWPGGW